MANVTVYVLRDVATKAILAYSLDTLNVGAGQELQVESVPDVDVEIFTKKYRYNTGTGVLEINGIWYYFLELSDDAVAHNPATGLPQLDRGGVDFLTLTFSKKDIQGVYHTAVGDTDRIYLSVSNGEIEVPYVDLVAGVGSGVIYSSTVRGITTITLDAVDVASAIFKFESV